MSGPTYVLMTVELPSGDATIESAARVLGVEASSLDPSFGVRIIDPRSGKYALMLDERFVKGARDRKGVAGPFSSPRIEPFGPPRS